MLIVMFVFVTLYLILYYLIYNPLDIHGTNEQYRATLGFYEDHELGTKGYLKSLADKILNGA